MLTVDGMLKGSAPSAYAGHRVSAAFQEKVIPEDGDAFWRSSERFTDVLPDASFGLSLPDTEAMQPPVKINVLAPGGEVLASEEFVLADLAKPISIEVAAKPTLQTAPSPDPYFGLPERINGRVLDVAGRLQVVDKQVVLWARAAEEAEGSADVVFVGRTDAQGYFSGPYPKGSFAEAYGVVGVGSGDSVPIPLEEGYFPEKVVLVVQVPETPPGTVKEGCACATDVPRAPDSEDFVNSPQAYSCDLGGGRCVDFTVPNRTLEEFNYYLVVRTTQPEIRGVTQGGLIQIPPKILLPPPQLVHLAMPDGGEKATRAATLSRVAVARGAVAGTTKTGVATGTTTAAPAASGAGDAQMIAVNAAALRPLLRTPEDLTPEKATAALQATQLIALNAAIDLYRKPYPGRGPLTVNNPVDWDETPTFYEATTIALGHLLHFKQVWKADGYSLGDLLYSLPLAPCQKKEVAIVDWERREAATRTEFLSEEERLAASISRDRDISEIVNSTLRESVEGGSDSSNWGVGGGLGAAGFGTIGVLSLGAVLGVAAGGGGASSSAWQDSSRDLAASSLQRLRDRTVQTASAVRSQRATVIQTVREGETARAETEVVHNHNHCHALTMEYFEVLRHFRIDHGLADIQECIFVPFPMTFFDRAKVVRWREPLTRVLRAPLLRPAFDAIERIENNYEGSDLPIGRYSQDTVEDIEGELRIILTIQRPADATDGSFVLANWSPLAPFLVGATASGFFFEYLWQRAEAERERNFQQYIAPRIAEQYVQSLHLTLMSSAGDTRDLKLDTTLVTNYAPGRTLTVTVRPLGVLPLVAREWISRVGISVDKDLGPDSRAILVSGTLRYRTRHMAHALFKDANIQNDLLVGDPAVVTTPLDAQELRNPREEDREWARKLLNHLNEHLEWYHKAIWWTMDKDRRYMFLDGFTAEPYSSRSIASLVENRLIGMVGNSLVLPVAPGFHLDPTYSKDPENPVDLFEVYAPITPVQPARISVPTRGVFAEAVMGSCNSCEKKDESRFWRYEESPCGDEPAPIQPVSTETRRAEPPSLTPTPFPAPLISIQAPPAAPEPGALEAALRVLGTPNLFRDVAGLEQTQKNAAAALSGVMDAAKSFGSQAAELTKQGMMMQDGDKAMERIKQARADNIITPEQQNSLAMDALQSMVGGRPRQEPHLTEQPEVRNLLNSAAQQPTSDVSVSRAGEAVSVSKSPPPQGAGPIAASTTALPGGAPPMTVDLRYDVALVPQPDKKSCWAASMAMLVGYRRRMSLDAETLAQEVGRTLRTSYSWDMLEAVRNYFGFHTIALPSNMSLYPSPEQWYDWLRDFGPLWVTIVGTDSHAIVVHGIHGDLTPGNTTLDILNPWEPQAYDNDPIDFHPSNYGIAYTRSFAQLAADFGNLALNDYGNWRVLYLGP